MKPRSWNNLLGIIASLTLKSRSSTVSLLVFTLMLTTTKQLIASPSTNPVPIAWIVRIKGEVQLKRRNWSNYRPTSVGTELYQGDLLQPADGTTAIVRCAADNTTRPVPAGKPSGASTLCPTPRVLKPQCPNGSCPRGNVVAINSNIPYIISPRKTVLLTNQPTLRWNSVPGAKNYTVRLQADGADYWQTQVSGTSVIYSGEKPLKPGVYYSLIIETDTGLSSLEEPGSELGFKLLDEKDQKQVQDAINRLSKEELNQEEKTLSIAYIYTQNDLKTEAIQLLEPLVEKGNQTTAIERTLAELYWQVELASQAESHYLKALERTSTEDIEGQALASDRLGELYATIGERNKAIQYIELALPKYEALGNSQRVNELKNRLSELANQKR